METIQDLEKEEGWYFWVEICEGDLLQLQEDYQEACSRSTANLYSWGGAVRAADTEKLYCIDYRGQTWQERLREQEFDEHSRQEIELSICLSDHAI